MDGVDLQIMRRMGLAPFLTWPHPPASIKPAALARSLGTSTDTIKRRLAALRKAGVFHGTQVFPNPRLLGLRMASFHFRLGAAARRLVPPGAVTKVPGVLGVFDMVGGDRCVDVAFADDGSRDVVRSELAGLLGAESSHFVDYASPAPTAMTVLDWRIIQALRRAPETSLEEAADKLGVSLRTVKRRFDRMAKDGCLDVIGLWEREGESLPFVERCEVLVLEAARENWEWLDQEIARRAGDIPDRPTKPVETTPIAGSSKARR